MGKSGNAKQRAISAVSEFGNTLKAQGATRRSAIRMLQQQSAHVRNSGELHVKNTAQHAAKRVLLGMAAKPAPF